MTSFGQCKVFHYKYNTTGHNFIGHYYVLHIQINIEIVKHLTIDLTCMIHDPARYCEIIIICGIPIFMDSVDSINPGNQRFNECMY